MPSESSNHDVLVRIPAEAGIDRHTIRRTTDNFMRLQQQCFGEILELLDMPPGGFTAVPLRIHAKQGQNSFIEIWGECSTKYDAIRLQKLLRDLLMRALNEARN